MMLSDTSTMSDDVNVDGIGRLIFEAYAVVESVRGLRLEGPDPALAAWNDALLGRTEKLWTGLVEACYAADATRFAEVVSTLIAGVEPRGAAILAARSDQHRLVLVEELTRDFVRLIAPVTDEHGVLRSEAATAIDGALTVIRAGNALPGVTTG